MVIVRGNICVKRREAIYTFGIRKPVNRKLHYRILKYYKDSNKFHFKKSIVRQESLDLLNKSFLNDSKIRKSEIGNINIT